MPTYLEKKILPVDPFQSLDQRGVGQLVEIGIEQGRQHASPTLKVGICGEHGGDPDSVVFCHKVGMDYVSCSPFRVPIARLAAAQAALKERRKRGEVQPKASRQLPGEVQPKASRADRKRSHGRPGQRGKKR